MLQKNTFDIHGTHAFYRRLRAEMRHMPHAVVHGSDGSAMTYSALLDRSDLIRERLPGPGRKAEESIAICAAKSPDCLAAVLAVLSTGQAYAPLDPTHPVARLTTILDDLQPGAVIVDASTHDMIAPWARAQQIPLVDLSCMPEREFSTPIRPVAVAQQDLAALLHTSGSTGKPKRVEIEAHALNLFQDWVVEELSLRIDDCVLSHAPFAFDLSFLDIYATLMAGAGLVLADARTARNGARLCQLMEQAGVTVWHSAPSALKLLAESAGDQVMPWMRCVLFAGEPMPARVLKRLFAIFPNARFLNIYGCTETNDTFFYEVPRQATPDPLPLGRKLPYVDFLLVDAEDREIIGAGEGELWVHCPTMMRGYSDPELTARALVCLNGRQYYRSGDLVRRDAAGMIHFVGRIDTVVKLSGVRVDLNEVDQALAAYPGVDEALCFVTRSGDGTVLNAWVTTQSDELNSLDLRLHLMKTLPAAAIPRNFTISLLAVPRNSNGKACRRLLAQNCDPAAA
ncbi:AMP-binding protein [Thalassococcus sp. CAU 1522]|uniref:AMP-binding protein n=1 Tax=Thalassococcus arenae TaxID=2851652 RepID=A0ABS6N2C4_9RHOB|nr:AMP-binding protein [Thalassococcus arenae]MBV2358171.1 AMP-binding protein [Thalassococcus arenae]